jgi:hypothetical protein
LIDWKLRLNVVSLKPSEYPYGTIIELDNLRYKKGNHTWNPLEGYYSIVPIRVADALVEKGVQFQVISIPWQLAQALISMVAEYGTPLGALNETDDILRQAIENGEL